MGNVPEYWERLRVTQGEVMQRSSAANTVKAYDHCWKMFSMWCEQVGLAAFPCSQSTVLDYATFCLYERQRKYRVATLNLALTAIRRKHEEAGLASPINAQARRFVRNAGRDLKEARGGKAALSISQLRRLCSFLTRESRTIAIRDRAMFLLQFAAGWRCSEVVGLQLEDVRFTRKGFVVSLGASKTDQAGHEGRIVGIQFGDREVTCPVRALGAWIALRGKWRGSLFCRIGRLGNIVEHGLTGDALNERLKLTLAQLSGIDAASYGSHSLRSGMVTAAIEEGKSETLIMMRTGHKSLDSMRQYVRSARAFIANPLEGLL
jgi:site-specific recombinase XerD